MRRALVLLLLLAAVGFVLAGCGTSYGPGGPPGGNAQGGAQRLLALSPRRTRPSEQRQGDPGCGGQGVYGGRDHEDRQEARVPGLPGRAREQVTLRARDL